ncbi:glycosyltransferase family 2 protein, partial [Candidatus Gottesmanbacteria bacterium]|nr:glycosyltransferase family 2 protein [Candidatus Gottesmanbacteria bacterium]
MSDTPLISVVIPVYNEEKYIARCLQSVCNQNFKNYEVIVVDNNCTDKTAKIAAGFKVKIIREKIQGMTPARERGFREAKSEIIARTDADTIIPNNWLSSIYKYF